MTGNGSDAAYRQHQQERDAFAAAHDAEQARQARQAPRVTTWPFDQRYRFRDAVARAYENRDRDELARLATLAEQHVADLRNLLANSGNAAHP